MNTILRNLKDANRIAVFSHYVPDADALCSSVALKKIIKNNYDDKIVDLFFDGEIGELYDHILRDEVINPRPLKYYDMAFVLDCPNLSRTGRYKDLAESIPVIFNIDHHSTNERFGSYNCVAPKCSSTCEIVYSIAKANNLEIDNDIAKSLFQGIITDTNDFTSYSVWDKTHRVASELMKYKFDHTGIREYYKKASKAKMTLLKNALDALKYSIDDKLAITRLSYQCFENASAKYEDTFGIIDEVKRCGAPVSAILIEKKPEDIYISMRGDGQVDIGEIAKANGGGGSQYLGAYQADGTLDEVETSLVKQLKPILDGLEQSDKKEEMLY